jgi:hypothetical protein
MNTFGYHRGVIDSSQMSCLFRGGLNIVGSTIQREAVCVVWERIHLWCFTARTWMWRPGRVDSWVVIFVENWSLLRK